MRRADARPVIGLAMGFCVAFAVVAEPPPRVEAQERDGPPPPM